MYIRTNNDFFSALLVYFEATHISVYNILGLIMKTTHECCFRPPVCILFMLIWAKQAWEYLGLKISSPLEATFHLLEIVN